MDKCRLCGRTDELVIQLCGFWFCFWCEAKARDIGAFYWQTLYAATFPWR